MRRLVSDRCFSILLPDGQDVNEYFQACHEIFDFQNIVKDAWKFNVTRIMSFNDGLIQYQKEAQRPDYARGTKTGFTDVVRVLKPHQSRWVAFLVKIAVNRKKSVCFTGQDIQCAARYPFTFLCLERRPTKITQKVIGCYSRTHKIGQMEIEDLRLDFKGNSFYIGYCFKESKLQGIVETLKAAVKRYGL